ncbi:hydantoinase/oxoprolinase family protein, partial [Marinibaculum pumilum]
LGRLDPDNFLGGEMGLDVAAATKVVQGLADSLGMSLAEAASGIITIVNNNMANAIRSRTVQKGIDPRDYSLVAFGGAGPLHGAEVARILSIPEVIVPPYPGITSAVGLLTSDLKYETIQTGFHVSGQTDLDRVNADYRHMADGLGAQFAADGIAAADVAFERAADIRYVGQGYELRVEVPAGTIDEGALDSVYEAFHRQHEAEYGHCFRDSPIEIVNLRLAGTADVPKIGRPAVRSGGSVEEARVKTAPATFRIGAELAQYDTGFYRRDLLPVGQAVPGPAIVLQTDSTTVVPPDCTVTAEANGNLIIKVGGAS